MQFMQNQNLRLSKPAKNFGANLLSGYGTNELACSVEFYTLLRSSTPKHQTVRSWQGRNEYRLEVLTT
jgi:hypothetical protein